MWRVVTSTLIALSFFSSAAAAQQPCTSDAGRVVSELYRHILERGPDAGAQHWQQQLANGQMTVREVVKNLVTSQEHNQRFGQAEAGEGTPYERAVARLYRHILSRQPDAEGQRANAIGAQQEGLNAVAQALLNSAEYGNNFGDWGVPGSGGVRFCAPANFSSAAPAPSTPAQSPITDARFRGMDTNHDGQVTRNEWRGNNRSFDVQDWNGDGVLSGEEVRAGGRRATTRDGQHDFDALDVNDNNRIERREWVARGDEFNRLDINGDNFLSRAEVNGTAGIAPNTYSFDALDANNNNRIERREWLARGDEFNRLDRNGDNFLTRAELADDDVPTGTAGDLVIVDSGVQWTDTGIDVRAGQRLVFDAEGVIRLSNHAGDDAQASGPASGRRAAGSPVPSAPAGGLIARIGNGAPVFVGDRRALRAPASGRLYLGVNDDHLGDNVGQFRVSIDVR